MTHQDSTNNTLREGHVTYQPSPEGGGGRIVVDFKVDQGDRRERLLNDTTEQLGGDIYDAAASIDAIATRHLQELTHTKAQLVWDGDVVRIAVDVPSSTADQLQPLTPAQTSLIPDLASTIAKVLPAQKQHHAHELARQVAAQMPTPAQATAAYGRTTLSQALGYAQNGTGPFVEPSLPPSLRTAGLSFPSHASAALQNNPAQPHTPQPAPPISSAKTANTIDR
ncbi:hypothetical protein FBY31_4410 [Arthrobacter sp. SLBN-100]|uniref:hypothetical protein n=1 Tax=Arthrobacter sp. SLBN-100 TaxID=2768450 RepID=UPI0011534A3D|nr:hypothetical protein [Arthrobacter sp. SLBN-100]TQJ62034.1 hypothetical protein FBY31_4410 [Arthrobacter sp. SLBN-100]